MNKVLSLGGLKLLGIINIIIGSIGLYLGSANGDWRSASAAMICIVMGSAFAQISKTANINGTVTMSVHGKLKKSEYRA
ncbi:hypothetical protein J4N45_09900 [Vibrio sp. SCSIO 43140]|uniref:hypothetical protein n=1 Tax=Vibrio sp. SCSIO 43140 TaxID=2819100 RepID=UPI002076182D|nr:hypothetical protein [Vibrio sp. SCSIO 43140]USD58841.1 hypothetical protein J4N45_09900 [Vibrio sp. SCSIO 43140]